MKKLVFLTLATIFLSGCADSEHPKHISAEEFSKYIQTHKVTQLSTADSHYWLEKAISSSEKDEWAKLILVFGYVGNLDACNEIKQTLTERYPRFTYRCTKANKSELKDY